MILMLAGLRVKFAEIVEAVLVEVAEEAVEAALEVEAAAAAAEAAEEIRLEASGAPTHA